MIVRIPYSDPFGFISSVSLGISSIVTSWFFRSLIWNLLRTSSEFFLNFFQEFCQSFNKDICSNDSTGNYLCVPLKVSLGIFSSTVPVGIPFGVFRELSREFIWKLFRSSTGNTFQWSFRVSFQIPYKLQILSGDPSGVSPAILPIASEFPSSNPFEIPELLQFFPESEIH